MKDDSPDPEAVEGAVEALYAELRTVAARHLGGERPGHTLQPTDIVHEAYLRLARQTDLEWESRVHFIHIASAQIRRILVDHARRRNRHKRGGGLIRVTLSESVAQAPDDFDLVELDTALDRLNAESAVDRQIVELKFFGGLTEAEIAEALGVSERTVRRKWLFCRTWLYRELGDGDA